MADVFVSYSRKDIDFVRTLVGALTERGKEVWVDWEGIPPTVEFMEEIRGAVESADAFLFVLSPDSATSRVCNEELDGAVGLNKRIIPVVRRDVPEADVPEEVAGLNWVFCRETDDLGQQVTLLVEALDTDYDWVRAHTRLLVRASEWDRKGQESSLLLRGKDLVEAEEQVARPDRKPEPTELQHSFVLASRRASARSQRLRLVAVTVALVVALVLAGLALLQRQTAQEQRDLAEERATIARSQQLAAQADSQLDVDPELSTLLALESIDVNATDEAEDVLRESITEANVVATLRGHEGAVVDIAEAERDGEPTVVTAGEDGTVRFWDPTTGEQQDELQAHDGGVYTMDVSADHGLFATSGVDRTVRVWNLATLEGVAEIPAAQPGHEPYDVAIDPSGERLAVSNFDGTVAVWDLRTGELTSTYRGHQTGAGASGSTLVRAVVWTPDGRALVSAGSDQIVQVWDADTGVTSLTYEDHPRLRVRGDITSLQVSPDGERVASSSGVETLVWAISDGQLITTVGRPGADAAVAAFSPDGSELVTGGTDGVGRLWFTQSGVEEDQFLGHRAGVRAVAWSSDGEHVVTASADGTARVWATRQGAPLAPVRSATEVTYVHGGDVLMRLAVDADGRAEIAEPDAPLSEGIELESEVDVAGGGVVATALSPDASRLAVADGSGGVLVFDTGSGAVVSEHTPVRVGPGGSPPPVDDLAFSPDGSRLASSTGLVQAGSTVTPGLVEVWDVESGRTVAQILPRGLGGGAEQFAPRLAWLGDEHLLTGGSSGEVQQWDAATGQESGDAYDEGAGEFVVDLAVSDDGERALSIGASGTSRVWEPGSGDPLATHTNRTVNQGAISPDGQLVATAGTDGAIEVWDGTSGDVLARYEQPDPPSILGFDPDDVATFVAMTFSGRRLEIVTPRRFECEQCGGLDDLVAYANERVTRELSDEERHRFLGDG